MKKLAVLLAAITLLPCLATAEPAVEEKKLKDWAFSFTPYFWLSNFRTDIDGEVIRGNVDQTSQLTESAFMFIGTASWRRWTFGIDALFSDLGTTQVIGPIDLDIKVHQEIITPKMGFKILDSRFASYSRSQFLFSGTLEAPLSPPPQAPTPAVPGDDGGYRSGWRGTRMRDWWTCRRKPEVRPGKTSIGIPRQIPYSLQYA